MRSGYRETELTGLDQILHGYLRRTGYLRQGAEVLAAVLWAEVVGPWYARHTTVARVEQGVLTVHCDSAPRAQQLQADSVTILERLNARVAERLAAAGQAAPPAPLREIRASSAHQGRGRRRFEPPASPAPSGPDPEEIAAQPLIRSEETQVLELAAGIAEPQLRERFAGAMRARLRLARWQRSHGWEECPECASLIPPRQGRCWICHPPEAVSPGGV